VHRTEYPSSELDYVAAALMARKGAAGLDEAAGGFKSLPTEKGVGLQKGRILS
jgi:hypothetical protein